MKFGSLFTGVGGFDLGLERAGMECSWQVEIDKYCNQVLDEHWKGIRRYNDVREITKENTDRPDLICGGFPCQDVSIAGKRAGFNGERSGLWFEFERIIGELRPEWVVIENVPGLFSSNKGRDFAIILKALDEFGYGLAWRILDSQNFGVAQRRRRVFIIGSLGSGRSAEILFERESVSGNTPQIREEGEGTARTFTIRSGKEGGETLKMNEKANTINGQVGSETTAFFNGVWQPRSADGVPRIMKGDKSPTLDKMDGGQRQPCVGVRRLTPAECERLQGFPDGWSSDIVSDTQAYKQMGNAVTVNVIEWIGKRIVGVDNEVINAILKTT